MQPRKLDIMIGVPAYGGNGGISSESPDIRRWLMKILPEMKQDERIGEIHELTLADTPITMVRNKFVVVAREAKVDVLMCIDSDMNPLKHAHDHDFKDFFFSSFNFLYEHYSKGPCVIGAPYCGPPGGIGSENVYVFEWQNYGDRGPDTPFSLEQVPRMMAGRMRGIQEAAALPTGLIMYDMRIFDVVEVRKGSREQVLDDLLEKKISKTEALRLLEQGWFYYEWEDNTASSKASTEDVTATRDMSLVGQAKLGYNPVFCNWDSPVGHWKPWCVAGRPMLHDASHIGNCYRRALEAEQYGTGSDQIVQFKAKIPETRLRHVGNGPVPIQESE